MSGLLRRISEMKGKGKPKAKVQFDLAGGAYTGSPIENAVEGGRGKKPNAGDHAKHGVTLAAKISGMRRKGKGK